MGTIFDEKMLMRDALQRYFEVNGFGPDGRYDQPWVTFKLGPVPVAFPNTAGRVRALKFHDFHHIVTGFDTDTSGEFEIAAWEIGAGCKRMYTAWVINLAAFLGGLLLCRVRTFRAFCRGRCECTGYGQDPEALFEMTVAEARARFAPMAGKPAPKATAADITLFALTALAAVLASLPFLVLFAVFLLINLAANPFHRRARPGTM